MDDLQFVSGEFLDCEVPRDKQWLLKYFTTDVHRAFLRYYVLCGETKLFQAHTGMYCSDRLKYRLLCRYRQLTKLHGDAKRAFTEESMKLLHKLESGQYPLTGKEFS